MTSKQPLSARASAWLLLACVTLVSGVCGYALCLLVARHHVALRPAGVQETVPAPVLWVVGEEGR